MTKRTREGRLPVEAYDEGQLHRFLVEDAVAKRATQLDWAIAAYTRIGQLSGKGSEDAYQRVLDEVETLTGSRLMPVAAATPGELKALGL